MTRKEKIKALANAHRDLHLLKVVGISLTLDAFDEQLVKIIDQLNFIQGASETPRPIGDF
jgi:hypothetical protein